MLRNRFSLSTLIILSLIFVVSNSESNPDSITLLSFKSSLSNPSKTILSSWVNTTDPCFDSWIGVTCHPVNHRVTRLVLEGMNLTGYVDSLSSLSELRLLSLKQNNLYSKFTTLNFTSWSNIKHLYLSYNRFSGSFPEGVGNVRRIRRLDLSHNFFYGVVPISELTRLTRLLSMRLEVNSLNGSLDSVNSLPSSVLEFNVSGNSLSGEIPAWGSRFPASSFAGNTELCGKPLMKVCSNRTVQSESGQSAERHVSKNRFGNSVKLAIISVYVVGILLAALVTVTCCYYYRRRRMKNISGTRKMKERGVHAPRVVGGNYGVWPREDVEKEEMVVFEGCAKGFRHVEDVLKASAEFLGKGRVGSTYKVVFEGGEVAVVKRVRERSFRRRKEVDGWLSVIGGLRHCNIVSLRAYFNSKDELLLVYDFLPNGNLHSLLHGNRGPWRTPLDWDTRLKLASGSASGLAFLHGYNKAKLYHGNLTSSSILVDFTNNACIADIGLCQLVQPNSLINDAYRAPELTNTSNNISQRKFTQKCDVYSFGIILLEILTGKTAGGEGETSLVKWVQKVGRKEWTWDVFDFELWRYKEMEEEMAALMQVALLCLSQSPRDRPKMNTVYRMIEDIRTKEGTREGGAANSIMNELSCDSSPALSEPAISF